MKWLLGDNFEQRYAHVDGGIKALWELKWKVPAQRAVYPFHDGAYEDFEKIFDTLSKNGINDGYSDEYTQAFFPTAEALVQQAERAESEEKRREASRLYLRAAVVYRISRFPILSSAVKRQAFDAQKKVYLKAASLWETPITEAWIEHTHAAGHDGKSIPIYLRTPSSASVQSPCPAILLMTGLDGHRPDNTMRTDEFLQRGWATVIVEIPGTADCPAARRDPQSPDRLWSAVLDWMQAQRTYNMNKIIAWGLSAGGYYAIRAAHTHRERLAGACGQGAGTHHFLGREWLDHCDYHEYPFALTPALVKKYGYQDVEELKAKAQKDFSLVDNGIVQQPSCRLLLVNGTLDGLMPIEDSMLLFEYGSPKEARFYSGLMHMGYPPANESVWPWLEHVMTTSG